MKHGVSREYARNPTKFALKQFQLKTEPSIVHPASDLASLVKTLHTKEPKLGEKELETLARRTLIIEGHRDSVVAELKAHGIDFKLVDGEIVVSENDTARGVSPTALKSQIINALAQKINFCKN